MHQIRISPEAIAFARRQRGGALHMFEQLDLSRTAHVIVDMQNGFVEPGAPVEVPVARDIVDNINAISRAVRESGGTNVFLQMTLDETSLQSWSNWFGYFHTAESTAGFEASFGHGRHGWKLWPRMDVGEDHAHVVEGRVVGRVGEGGVGVGDEHQLVVHLHRVAGGGLAAAVAEGAGDDQGVDAAGLQDLVQGAGAGHKGAETGLVDEQVALADVHARP